jgi:hypothetical protein
MKKLKSILEASILGDIDTQIDTMDSDIIRINIQSYIDRVYFSDTPIVISSKPNKDGKYLLTANNVTVKDLSITSLTDGTFIWDKVYGTFCCNDCKNLKSLEGSPKEARSFLCKKCDGLKTLEYLPKKILDAFNCSYCKNLESLKGLPKKLRTVNCSGCESLKSLKGLPDSIEYLYCEECDSLKDLTGASSFVVFTFMCDDCKNLTSLKGGPLMTGSDFSCRGCKKLKSLEFAPEHVAGTFYCGECGKFFTRLEVKAVTKATNINLS